MRPRVRRHAGTRAYAYTHFLSLVTASSTHRTAWKSSLLFGVTYKDRRRCIHSTGSSRSRSRPRSERLLQHSIDKKNVTPPPPHHRHHQPTLTEEAAATPTAAPPPPPTAAATRTAVAAAAAIATASTNTCTNAERFPHLVVQVHPILQPRHLRRQVLFDAVTEQQIIVWKYPGNIPEISRVAYAGGEVAAASRGGGGER